MSDYKELDSIPDLGKFVDWVWEMKAERDQLKVENQRLEADHDLLISNALPREFIKLRADYDQVRAELAGLRTGFDAQNEVIAGLRKDAERYQWLRLNVGAFRTGEGLGPISCYLLSRPPATDSVANETDEAIDAAMGKGGEA